MRTFDLAPLYRSTVGFDRLFSMLDGFEAAPGYPPYNIERTGENDYRITVAVSSRAPGTRASVAAMLGLNPSKSSGGATIPSSTCWNMWTLCR